MKIAALSVTLLVFLSVPALAGDAQGKPFKSLEKMIDGAASISVIDSNGAQVGTFLSFVDDAVLVGFKAVAEDGSSYNMALPVRSEGFDKGTARLLMPFCGWNPGHEPSSNEYVSARSCYVSTDITYSSPVTLLSIVKECGLVPYPYGLENDLVGSYQDSDACRAAVDAHIEGLALCSQEPVLFNAGKGVAINNFFTPVVIGVSRDDDSYWSSTAGDVYNLSEPSFDIANLSSFFWQYKYGGYNVGQDYVIEYNPSTGTCRPGYGSSYWGGWNYSHYEYQVLGHLGEHFTPPFTLSIGGS